MTPADIESDARDLEREARNWIHLGAHEMDQAIRHKTLADSAATCAASHSGHAAGLLFRAAELRCDARGGMTEALERRRFEPGARWSFCGEACTVASRDESGLRLERDGRDGYFERASEMTRANGWLFLGLSDQGGYR